MSSGTVKINGQTYWFKRAELRYQFPKTNSRKKVWFLYDEAMNYAGHYNTLKQAQEELKNE